MPPPVMCAYACTPTFDARVEQRGRVDDARFEQYLGERDVRAGPSRVVQTRVAALEQTRRAPVSSRCTAGPGSRPRRSGRRPARRGAESPTARRRRLRNRRDRTRPAPSPRDAPTSRRRATRTAPGGNLRRRPRRARRSLRARACRSRCSRGRTAVRRPAPRCRRPTWRHSRSRSCSAGRRAARSTDFVPTPSVDDTSSGSS